MTDPLTGLHNRRFLQEYTEKLVAGVRRRAMRSGNLTDVHGSFVSASSGLGLTPMRPREIGLAREK